MTLICAKFDAYLINISKVTSRKTKLPRFFGLPCIFIFTNFQNDKVIPVVTASCALCTFLHLCCYQLCYCGIYPYNA